MVEALLITRPKIDFNNLFLATSQALGRSITKEIDSISRELPDGEKLILALDSFSKATNELFFLHYTFLCYCDKETAYRVREWTKLDVASQTSLDGEIIFFATGSLETWRQAIEACCSEKSDFNLRLLFDKILLIFEKEGLSSVWATKRKRTLRDKTFLIEDKR